MRRGFPYETSITSKKEGEISVESRILRSVTMSRDNSLGYPGSRKGRKQDFEVIPLVLRRRHFTCKTGEVRAQRVILPCERYVACTLPPKPGVPLVAAPGFPSPLTRLLLLPGVLFQAVNHFGSVFFIMA